MKPEREIPGSITNNLAPCGFMISKVVLRLLSSSRIRVLLEIMGSSRRVLEGQLRSSWSGHSLSNIGCQRAIPHEEVEEDGPECMAVQGQLAA